MSHPDRSLLDALHGWLVLAPLVVLCAPPGYSPFDGAPDLVPIGTAVAALGILPALLVTLLRGFKDSRSGGDGALTARSRLRLLAPLWVTLISAAVVLPRVSDSFSGWRSLIGLCAAMGFVVSGAQLEDRGRRVLQGGLCVVALALLLSTPLSEAWTGALGNTGDLSEAALPCAVLGAGIFLTSGGPLAFAGLAAIFAFALFAGFVPVYAGLASLGLAVVVGAVGAIFGRHGGEAGRQGAAKRLRILLVALAVGLLPMGYRALVGPATLADPAIPGAEEAALEADEPHGDSAGASAPQPADATASTTGGFAFRRLTWRAVPAMIEDHLEFGVGPGQFQAAFPPYRSQEEILLSSFNRREPTPIEVEHAHNDWLTAVAEHGPVGGGAFVLFLLIVLIRALRATWGPDRSRRDFGFAAVAILANASFNAPLLYGPAAPAISFAIFGVILGGSRAEAERAESRSDAESGRLVRASSWLAPALALAAVGLVAPRSLRMLEYGQALAETPSAVVVTEDGREKLAADKLGAILDRALKAEPLAPMALEKKAQYLSRIGSASSARRRVLDLWTRVRPKSFAAHLAMGALQARDGDFSDALESFERAHSVDPTHPMTLENRLRAACDLRDPELADLTLRDFQASGQLDPARLRSLAIEQLLTGRLEVAAPLVRAWTAGVSPPERSFELRPTDLSTTREGADSARGAAVNVLDANDTYAARKAAQEADDDLLADAYNVAFQMVTALDFLERGFPSQAAISAHQALKSARGRGLDLGAIRLRKAAAKAAAALTDGNATDGAGEGLRDEAEAILREAPTRQEDRAALAPVERDALRRAGLLDAQAALETETDAETEPGAPR